MSNIICGSIDQYPVTLCNLVYVLFMCYVCFCFCVQIKYCLVNINVFVLKKSGKKKHFRFWTPTQNPSEFPFPDSNSKMLCPIEFKLDGEIDHRHS